MPVISNFSSPEHRKMIAGRKVLESDTERAGYDLAHSTMTWLVMRLPMVNSVEVLRFAHEELSLRTSKLGKIKAAAVWRRLKVLEAAASTPGNIELPMVARFQRKLWSQTRHKIDAMEVGAVLELPWEEYYNANTSVQRSNHAYQGTRKYEMSSRRGLRITITRIL